MILKFAYCFLTVLVLRSDIYIYIICTIEVCAVLASGH